jgi:glutathione peroxidase
VRKISLKTFGILVVLCQLNVFAHAYEPKAKKAMATEGKRDNSDKKLEGDGQASTAVKNTYDFHLAGPDGKDIPLADFKDKVIMVVNLARNSSYNSQLPALIKLSEMYKDKGLVVIGIPSNDCGAGEPGTDAEIQKIYKTDDKVPFPVMARSSLVGEEEIPFYQYLT